MENGLSDNEKLIESKIRDLQENLESTDISLEYKQMPYEKISEYHIIISFLFVSFYYCKYNASC